MAKRNRDRSESRTATGGVRRTEAVRGAERRAGIRDADARRAPASRFLDDAFDLDLSAFYETPLEAVRNEIWPESSRARPQETVRPGARSSMQNRKAADDAAKRTKYKRAEPPRVRASTQTLTARREHLQVDQPSTKSRKESARGVCKERPDKTKGSGGGRKFVPWCDRKR